MSHHLHEHASPVRRAAPATATGPTAAVPPGGVPASADEPVPGTGVVATIFRLYPALTSPSFRLLWLGSIPSTMAWQLCVIATGYAALTLSGSATELGIVTSLGGLPMLVLAPIGGVVADCPRRLPAAPGRLIRHGTVTRQNGYHSSARGSPQRHRPISTARRVQTDDVSSPTWRRRRCVSTTTPDRPSRPSPAAPPTPAISR